MNDYMQAAAAYETAVTVYATSRADWQIFEYGLATIVNTNTPAETMIDPPGSNPCDLAETVAHRFADWLRVACRYPAGSVQMPVRHECDPYRNGPLPRYDTAI